VDNIKIRFKIIALLNVTYKVERFYPDALKKPAKNRAAIIRLKNSSKDNF